MSRTILLYQVGGPEILKLNELYPGEDRSSSTLSF
jgi:hypothetical protein